MLLSVSITDHLSVITVDNGQSSKTNRLIEMDTLFSCYVKKETRR